MDSKRSGWRNAKHATQWMATLEAHAFPVIGHLPVRDVGTDEVLQVLRPIWERIPETASRLRRSRPSLTRHASSWRISENPARWKGHLAGELPQPRKVKRVQHQPALNWHNIGAFMAALGEREGISALALRFVVLTAAHRRGARHALA